MKEVIFVAFYCRNLEDTIFNKHKSLTKDPDELVIISGYLGPAPVKRLKELPFKTIVIAGMYSKGVNSRLYQQLKTIEHENPQLTILFSKIEVHSKIYIWMCNNEPKYVLIGSANFSDNGLLTDFRESLADMDLRDTSNLLDYYDIVKKNSVADPKLSMPPTYVHNSINNRLIINNDPNKGSLAVYLPLYSYKQKEKIVPPKSGLNWGNSNGHTAVGDAYIPIPKSIISAIPHFFEPFDPKYISKTKRKRDSDPIEIIWDDNTTMEASAEGIQVVNGKDYPKQVTSYSNKSRNELNNISKKSIIGRYLRKRLHVSVEHTITYKDLENYGRDNIAFEKISEGVYSADFSVKK